MSSIKRLDSQESQTRTKRLKPLDSISDDGPLTQGDVVYYKKEAIWRQMQAYKLQLRQFAQDIKRYQQAYLTIEGKLGILDSWYHQIITLFAKLATVGSASEPSGLSPLCFINMIGHAELDSVLEERRRQLCAVLEPLFESIADDARQHDSLSALEKVTAELASMRASNAQLSGMKEDLEERASKLQRELANLSNKRNREQSLTLQRADESFRSMKLELDEPAESIEAANNVKIEPDDQRDHSLSPLNAALEALLKDATKEVETLTSKNAQLADLLASIEKKYTEATMENTKTAFKLENLNEKDLEDNIHYTNLKNEKQALQAQINKLAEINNTNVQRLSEIDAREEHWIEKLRNESAPGNESLREQIEKQEQDLVRIRTARDELLGKNAILKAELEQLPSAEDAITLAKSLSDHMLSLEKQKTSVTTTEDLASLDKSLLISRVQQLSSEIVEIEAAFRSIRQASLTKAANAIDLENMVKKLSVEKSKADQKYFAAMRGKDALLAENRLLKAQVAKLQELVKVNADLEKQLRVKIDAMSAQIKDYRQIKDIANHDVRRLEARCKSLAAVRDSLTAQVTKNGNDIDEKSLTLLLTQAKVKAHEMQTTKLESQLAAATQQLEKFRLGHQLLLLKEDREQLDALRSIAKCSLCLKNWKDTAITVCGHVFCHDCTNERLAARLRRCPTCNKGFSANDLLAVHL